MKGRKLKRQPVLTNYYYFLNCLFQFGNDANAEESLLQKATYFRFTLETKNRSNMPN